MIRTTFDTNVVASGVLGYERGGNTPGTLLRLWLEGTFLLITSSHLNAEIERTLNNPYFAERVKAEIRLTIQEALRERASIVAITAVVRGVASHPEDDLVLATALSAAADYLVTGDRQLLKLGAYEGVTIVRPRDFLDILDSGIDDPA